MNKNAQEIADIDDNLQSFVDEVTAALRDGQRHKTPGFGTFSTCARKATADRAACKIAMFRPSAELRTHVAGDAAPAVAGPHAEVVKGIIAAMQTESGANVPRLGRLAAIAVPGKKPKLIFHGAPELNDTLGDS